MGKPADGSGEGPHRLCGTCRYAKCGTPSSPPGLKGTGVMQRPGGRHEVGLVPQGRILLPKRCVRLAGPRGPFRHLAAISRALSRSPTLARLIPKATRLL